MRLFVADRRNFISFGPVWLAISSAIDSFFRVYFFRANERKRELLARSSPPNLAFQTFGLFDQWPINCSLFGLLVLLLFCLRDQPKVIYPARRKAFKNETATEHFIFPVQFFRRVLRPEWPVFRTDH